MARDKGGRPSKLTPDVKRRLMEAIRLGNYLYAACAFAGISIQTFHNWMDKGEKAKSGEYLEFFDEVTRAQAEAETRMVTLWQRQIPEDWKAARDFLARRFPERWAPREKKEITGKDGGAIEVDIAELRGKFMEKIIRKAEALNVSQLDEDEDDAEE